MRLYLESCDATVNIFLSKYHVRQWIDLIKMFEARRGLAPIGEMRARVFWNPLHSDMLAMLKNSSIGDLRGSVLYTDTETLTAIWPARILGHWNFHNECYMREGIASTSKIDFRIVRKLAVLEEERYWKSATHFEGVGFFCACSPDTDINAVPELAKLFGKVEKLGPKK